MYQKFLVSLNVNGYLLHPLRNMKFCLGDIMIGFRHIHGIQFDIDAIAYSDCVWEHHF